VLIPDRDAPDLLGEALDSIDAAFDSLGESRQLIVVANGAPKARYASVAEKYPGLEFLHDPRPCGFSTAIHRGLAHARYDWTLLLNNDMTIEPSALARLASIRAAGVFAIAPQILQQSADGRREETGFVDWYVDDRGVHAYHAPVPRGGFARPHLCASGGAGLFRTALLRRYVRAARAYDPFYWEDVEWGVQARRDGFQVLHCPDARVRHRHRMTTSRFYAEPEIARIVERNRLLFDLRNAVTDRRAQWLLERVCDQPYTSQKELASLIVAARVLRHRWRSRRQPRVDAPPVIADPRRQVAEPGSSFSYTLGHRLPRTRVLVVTPFCVFPPRHGGARRVEGLLQRLRHEFDIVVLSDEASLYDARSFAYFDGLQAVKLVQRRECGPLTGDADLEKRIELHCHETMIGALQKTLAEYRPDVVQIEHVELAALSRLRMPGQKWVLALHDAFVASDFRDSRAASRLNQHLSDSYDAVTVCSPEDRRLIGHPRVICVPNGTSIEVSEHAPSASAQLLFMGPFRYVPNLQGIRRFLHVAYPQIKAAVPSACLLVLAGDRAEQAIAGDAAFAQPGVSVVGHREDVSELLRGSALTLNPLSGIRGSSIKVIESLAAGRACVSTKDGARGFVDAGLAGLVVVNDVEAMAAPIITLLKDSRQRHHIEKPDAERLEQFQWRHCAAIQSELYRNLVADGVG
jgi:GT2 family glycosyltransferase/glycosyltransferase involved in cell wall biosynthesis